MLGPPIAELLPNLSDTKTACFEVSVLSGSLPVSLPTKLPVAASETPKLIWKLCVARLVRAAACVRCAEPVLLEHCRTTPPRHLGRHRPAETAAQSFTEPLDKWDLYETPFQKFKTKSLFYQKPTALL